jgi:hypothetical protein
LLYTKYSAKIGAVVSLRGAFWNILVGLSSFLSGYERNTRICYADLLRRTVILHLFVF